MSRGPRDLHQHRVPSTLDYDDSLRVCFNIPKKSICYRTYLPEVAKLAGLPSFIPGTVLPNVFYQSLNIRHPLLYLFYSH